MENREIELRTADLFALLLKSAKFILIATLIITLLGSAFGVCRVLFFMPSVTEEDVQDAETSLKLAEKTLDNEKELFKWSEIAAQNTLRQLEREQQLVQLRQEYMDNSLYYAIDPLNCGVSRLTFSVQSDPKPTGKNEELQTTLAMIGETFNLLDEETLGSIRSILNTKAERRFIEELISIKVISDHFVEIKVCSKDAKVAEQVVNCLFKTMVSRLEAFASPESIVVVGTSTGYEVNLEMNDNQIAFKDRLLAAEDAVENARTSLQAFNDSLPKHEKAVDEARDALESAEKEYEMFLKAYETTRPSITNIIKIAIKYGLVSLFGGLILSCGIVLVIKLGGGRLQNQCEAKSRYSIPLLGVLPRTKKVWFDKTIRKLEGESVGEYEEIARATAQSILFCIGDRSVCLISTEGKSVAEKLAADVDERIKVCGDVIDDINAVRALSGFDGVILVEQRGRSRVQLIDSEIIRVRSLGKEILGMVLI